MPECCQCSNEAIGEFQGYPLCLDCLHKLYEIQQIKNQGNLQLMAMINYVSDHMRYTAGLTDAAPRLQVPNPVVWHIPVKFNHIKVDNSVVGTISTGDMAQIDTSLSHIFQQGHKELVEAMSDFTSTMLSTNEVDDTDKRTVLELLSTMSQQLATNTAKKSVTQSLAHSIHEIIKTVPALITLWEKVPPILKSIGL